MLGLGWALISLKKQLRVSISAIRTFVLGLSMRWRPMKMHILLKCVKLYRNFFISMTISNLFKNRLKMWSLLYLYNFRYQASTFLDLFEWSKNAIMSALFFCFFSTDFMSLAKNLKNYIWYLARFPKSLWEHFELHFGLKKY